MGGAGVGTGGGIGGGTGRYEDSQPIRHAYSPVSGAATEIAPLPHMFERYDRIAPQFDAVATERTTESQFVKPVHVQNQQLPQIHYVDHSMDRNILRNGVGHANPVEQHQVPISRLLSAPGDCGTHSFTPDDRHSGLCRDLDKYTEESKFMGKPFVRGKNAKIRYFGKSHMSSLMSQFDGLRCFMREAAPLNPTLPQFRRDMGAWKENIREQEEMDEFPCLPNLLESVPPSSEADELVRVYMRMFESTHRIVHIPSFWKEYREFWMDKPKASPAFVAQLLLIMACGMLLHHNSGGTLSSTNEHAVHRQRAVQWVHAVERWLCHRQRHDINLIRIHCLLIIAKRVNSIELHALWVSVGTLVRLAMTMGLHRDPDSLWKVSVFHAEMRRRLWATILELDLQAAMERGMPVREGSYYDCRPPLNINDWDIMESSEVLPNMRTSGCTETSFQVVMLRSLPIRTEVARLVNSLDAEPPYEEILRLDKEVTQCLQDIPHNLKIETMSKVHIEAGLPLPKQLIDLYLRRFLLLLHVPFAARRKDPRYNYSRHVCLENATMLLSHSKQFQDTTVLRALYFKDEHMQAALAICLDLYANKPNAGKTSPDGEHGRSVNKPSLQDWHYLQTCCTISESPHSCWWRMHSNCSRPASESWDRQLSGNPSSSLWSWASSEAKSRPSFRRGT